MTSPIVVFGRAMLLGLTVQGDPGTCYSAYPSCPRDPDRLVDYLNNHRGGLFRFFSATGLPAYYTQQYSQARIQTQRLPMPQTNLRPPRITMNIDKGHRHFLPQRKVLTHKILPPLNSRPSSEFQRPLTFPGDRGRLYSDQQGEGPGVEDIPRREQHFSFPDRARTESSRLEASTESYASPINLSIHRLPPPVAVQLPDRTGTGELRIDNDENTFGPSPFPSRYRRDVLSTNGPNTSRQRMAFPLNDEHHSKTARQMRFPSDTHEKYINFPPDSESTRDDYRKLNSFYNSAALNQQAVWEEPRDDVTRDLVQFPKSTNERENWHEPKRHLMKFPSDNNLSDDATNFKFETSKNKKSTRRMKFPVEYSGESEKSESNHILTKEYNSVTKVKFQKEQGFREAPSYGFIFPHTRSKESSNVAKTSFNHENSKTKSTRRMKFPVEYSGESERSESNHILTKEHNIVSKVEFLNEQGFREAPSYGFIFPHTESKESSNVAKTSFNHETSKTKSTRRMKFPIEDFDQSGKSESNYVITKDNNDISKVRFQDGFEETSSYGIMFPQNRAKDSSNASSPGT